MSFKKELKKVDIFCLALGSIIGFGAFVLPGTSFLPKAGVSGTAIGLIIGGLLVCIIGINYGFLIKQDSDAGGEFSYAYKNFGKTIGFICGWFLLLAYICIIPLNATAVAMIGRYVFPNLVNQGYLYSVAGYEVYLVEVLIALAFLLFFAFINCKGVRIAGSFQTWVVFILIGAIGLLTVASFVINAQEISNLLPLMPTASNGIVPILSIVAMTPWAFIGFDCIPQATQEYNFSSSKAKSLILISIVLAVLMYICINTITALAFPWEAYIAQKPFWATGTSVYHMLGIVGTTVLVIAMLSAVISGINGFYLTTSRLIYAMAEKKVLPKALGKIDAKTSIPKNAILFSAFISIIAPWFGREVLGWIVDMCSVGVSIAYFLTCLATVKISVQQKNKGMLFMGILGCLCSLLFLALLLIPNMPGFLSLPSFIMLFIWIVLGVIFYFTSVNCKKSKKQQ